MSLPTDSLRADCAIMSAFHLSLLCLVALAYAISLKISGNVRQSSTSIPVQTSISPRKALFLDIVQSGLEDRFGSFLGNDGELSRVYSFLQYVRGELDAPVGINDQHDPCEEYIDGLKAMPWWNPSDFDWVQPLEEGAPIIQKELELQSETRSQNKELFKGDSNVQTLMGSGWTAFRLQRMGEWNEENSAKFPLTTKLVKALKIPLAVRGVMFAKQEPGSGVQPHSDGRNFILTCHLGLRVPRQDANNGDRQADDETGCWIKVADEKRQWENGKAIVFDTSFTHSTGNFTDDERLVLIIDFWHPDLSEKERQALEFVYDARNKFESGKAKEIDASWVKDGRPLTVDAYLKKNTNSLTGFMNNFTNKFF